LLIINHHTQVEADITENIGTVLIAWVIPKEALTFFDDARKNAAKVIQP